MRRATAGSGKKLSLELGGKSPVIVFDSADLDSTVEDIVDAIWFNQGQVRCTSCEMYIKTMNNLREIKKNFLLISTSDIYRSTVLAQDFWSRKPSCLN